jgi:hypothetical protein
MNHHSRQRRNFAQDRPSSCCGFVPEPQRSATKLEAARAAGCMTADGGHMVEAVQDLMADFMLGG